MAKTPRQLDNEIAELLKDLNKAKRFRSEQEAITLSNQLSGAVMVPTEVVKGRQHATMKKQAIRKLTKREQSILDKVRHANELGALAGLPGEDKFVRRLADAGDIIYVDRTHVGLGKGWVAKDGSLALRIEAAKRYEED